MQVPAEDAIPVPVDCSEWLVSLGYCWWGHQYAARLRDGAEAARRPLKEMKQIVEDRLHRSSSKAFTARLPSKEQRRAARDATERSLSNGKEGCAMAGKPSKFNSTVRAKLAVLRKREDSSKIGWDELNDAIHAHGGLSNVDETQCWVQVMENLRMDPPKIQDNASHFLRMWYVERKARKMSKARLHLSKKRPCEESGDEGQPFRLPRDSLQGLESGSMECEGERQEDNIPLRPRKLTARLYQQHVKNLRELFSPSLLGTPTAEPRWRACALGGSPCLRKCNCPWTTFSNSIAPGTNASNVREETASRLEDTSRSTFARDESVENRFADFNDDTAETNHCAGAADATHRAGAADATQIAGQEPGNSTSVLPSSPSSAPDDLQTSTPALHSENGGLAGDLESKRWNKSASEAEEMSKAGNVCSSNVSRRKGSDQSRERAHDDGEEAGAVVTCGRCSKEARWPSISNGCTGCQDEDIKLASINAKASILGRWWRKVKTQNIPRVLAASASPCADDREVIENAQQGGASLHDNPKHLAQCPGCSKDFGQWVHQQRAALSKRHMQKCCPHLLSDASIFSKKARTDSQKASAAPLALPHPEQDGMPEAKEAERRFQDSFAAYRCCGRTFLRTHDLERHWARRHKYGVIACHRGYADPGNLTRKTVNQLGLGVRLVAPDIRPREKCVDGDGVGQEAGKAILLESATAADMPTHGHLSACSASQTFQLPGRGKGGYLWLPHHGPSSSCANDAGCDSDDSIDIVLR